MSRKPPKISRGQYLADIPLEAVRRLLRRLVSKGDCWVWTGATDDRGYGVIKVQGQAQWVHRVAYAAFRGELPDGKEVHHTCHNPPCCNPVHLEALSPRKNRAKNKKPDD